ncbi:RNA 2',3'-cyclic phosphodiesterase [Povalibacter sp.]|uniref:RNA 2',3'-cyclic phosphodiesterase n=1 Tax=Povalibacter sp. TaxID=1962978 RepID=UPI002F42E43B
MPESQHRLFFALWPADDLRARIERDTRAFVAQAGGRPIPAANFHITLVFIGDVPAAQIEAARIAAGAVTARSFSLSLDMLESWTGADVLVYSGEYPPPALGTLIDRLRISLLQQHFKLQRQTFKPHVTLVRKLPRRLPKQPLPRLEWPVNDFVLVESQAEESGSVYKVIGRWPLA